MGLHVHIDAFLLAMGAMLSHNLIRRNDQPMVYAFKLLNKAKQNYNTTYIKALVMVFALHKFRHYLALRLDLSLNNHQNNEMKFCENLKFTF